MFFRKLLGTDADSNEHGLLFLTSILVGIIGGLGAIAFRFMLKGSRFLFFQLLLPRVSVDVAGMNVGVIVLPALGGLIVGPAIYIFAREAKGHGVPEVIEAVHRKAGLIRPVVAFVKIVVSSVTIGSGGSAGREGPIAQIGAVFGSICGRAFFKTPERRKVLVCCGVASGISATFNAPLGGALFAMEVIAARPGFTTAIPILVSAVVGDVVMAAFLGLDSAFAAPKYTFGSVAEVPVFALVGIVFGGLSFLWSTVFYRIERRFDRLRFPEPLKPLLGGLGVGVVGMMTFDHGVMGSDYGDIVAAMNGGFPMRLLLLLGALKILATSLSVGSGGSGGIFAPTLYIGSMFGAATGLFAQQWFPNIVDQPSAYTLIGMGALFAGVGRAPVTALVMIPEMTRNHLLLIPMAIVSTISYFVASRLTKNSMYLEKLVNRGIKIHFRENVLEGVLVRDAMTKQLAVVSPDMPLSHMSRMVSNERHPAFPVVDVAGAFVGVVTVYDMHRVSEAEYATLKVGDVMRADYPHVLPTNSVYHALRVMVKHGLGRIPVIEKANGEKANGHWRIVGVVSKTDVVRAYGDIMD